MTEKIFRDRLRQLRTERGVTQMQMSLELHMTKNYIYNIERGYAYPSMVQFFSICSYFDLTPAEFMEFEPTLSPGQEELLRAVQGFSDEELAQLIAHAHKKQKR